MQRDFCNALFATFVQYLEKRGHDEVWEFFAGELGVGVEWLKDSREWHSAEFLQRFCISLEKRFPQYPDYFYELVFEAYAESRNPFFQSLGQLVVDPELFCSLAPRFARRMNLYCQYEFDLVERTWTLARARMRQTMPDSSPAHLHRKSPDMFRGALEGIFAYTRTPLLECKMTKSQARGDPYTELELAWPRKRNLSRILSFLFLAAFCAVILSPLGWPPLAWITGILCIPLSALGVAHFFAQRRVCREQFEYQQKALTDLRRVMAEKDKLNQKLTEYQGLLEKTLTFASVGEFSFGVAHDMASPIMLLSLYTQQMNQLLAARSSNPGELSKISRSIELATSRLQKLQQLFHIIAKGYRSASETEQDPARIAESILELYGPFFERNGIRVDFRGPQVPVLIRGQDGTIEAILLNLVQNAVNALVRAPHRDKRLSLGIEIEREIPRISVSDNGPGIPPERRENLWTVFGSSENSTGFGLYSVKKTADRLGARIEVKTGDPGTTFILTFPPRPFQPADGLASRHPLRPGPPSPSLSKNPIA